VRRDAIELVTDELRRGSLLAAALQTGLVALIRRDEEQAGPDGYPSSVGGSSNSTISTHSIRSTTESAGMRLIEYGPDRDPIHDLRVTAVRAVHDAIGKLLVASNAVKAAEKIETDNRGRQSAATECGNCGAIVTGVGEDRIKAGRCPRCYTWRLRHGGQDWRGEVA
jgi:hypothetical protein